MLLAVARLAPGTKASSVRLALRDVVSAVRHNNCIQEATWPRLPG